MSPTIASTDPSFLVSHALVFASLAGLLGPDTEHLAEVDALDRLDSLLEEAGDERAVRTLRAWRTDASATAIPLPDAATLAGRWIRWFEHGRIAPYEGSNVIGNAGGVTPRLADIAGFYRAFGVEVRGERPDHVVAELEFMAFALVQEAAALERGDAEAAEVCADAVRIFVRDHVGTWLDAWAARVGEEPALAPWAPVAAVAAVFVDNEARRRNVVPLRVASVLVDHVDPTLDDVTELPICGTENVDPVP